MLICSYGERLLWSFDLLLGFTFFFLLPTELPLVLTQDVPASTFKS